MVPAARPRARYAPRLVHLGPILAPQRGPPRALVACPVGPKGARCGPGHSGHRPCLAAYPAWATSGPRQRCFFGQCSSPLHTLANACATNNVTLANDRPPLANDRPRSQAPGQARSGPLNQHTQERRGFLQSKPGPLLFSGTLCRQKYYFWAPCAPYPPRRCPGQVPQNI